MRQIWLIGVSPLFLMPQLVRPDASPTPAARSSASERVPTAALSSVQVPGPAAEYATANPADLASIDQEAPSPFVRIEYKHERTFLHLDVIQLDITVADEVGREVERLVAAYHQASSRSRSGETTRDAAQALEDSIANAYLHTPKADVGMLFLRSVSHRQFMGGRDDALEAMVKEQLLTDAEAELLTEDTDQLFAFLRSAPIHKGDEIRYTVRGDTVKTLVLWEDGTAAQNIVRTTPEYRLYTMGSLFARGAEFRDGLMRTVLDPSFASGR